MSEPETVSKPPVSAKQLAANRMNSMRSTGPRTLRGKAQSSMNRLSHGMTSTKDVLPFESESEFFQQRDDLIASLNPADAQQELLAVRAAKHAWKIQRGERAEEANATKAVYAVFEGIEQRESAEVARLAPLIDTDAAAVRQLRTFLGGIDYLWQEWSILKARLSRGKPLLYSERQRCFRLLGTSWESVLRSEPVATRLLRAQIGVLCGPQATLEEVRGFLGGRPPVGMPEAEFTMRVKELAASLAPQAQAFQELAKIVGEAMDELKTVRQEVQEQTERHLELDSISAQIESTPEGTRLANRIDKSERGLMAALRRVQLLQQPAPKRAPKTSGASAAVPTAAASPPAEPEVTVSPEPGRRCRPC